MFGTAERKILLAFLYYITLGVFTLTTFSKATSEAEQNTIDTYYYFECEKNGRNNTCVYDVEQQAAMGTISFILLAVFPAFNLVYALNVQEFKGYLRYIKNKTASIVVSTSSGQL